VFLTILSNCILVSGLVSSCCKLLLSANVIIIIIIIINISAKKYQNPFTCAKVMASQRWDDF